MRIIYFDGVCNLCHGFVDFVLSHDPTHKFHFTSLQGQTAHNTLKDQDLGLDSIVLSVDQKILKKSKAVLFILNELGGFLGFVSRLGQFFPTFFLDFIYDLIAKHRYYFFGKKNTCRRATDSEKKYFLD